MAPEPGRGEHFFTSVIAFTQGPSIPQVPLVTADQQIPFAQMAHLSLGVTLTSCSESPQDRTTVLKNYGLAFFETVASLPGPI